MKEILDSVSSMDERAKEAYEKVLTEVDSKPVEMKFTVNREAISKMLNEEVQKLANGQPVDLGKILKLRAYMDDASVSQTIEETSAKVRSMASSLEPMKWRSEFYDTEGNLLPDAVDIKLKQMQDRANGNAVSVPVKIESAEGENAVIRLRNSLKELGILSTDWNATLQPVDKTARGILDTLDKTKGIRESRVDVNSNANDVLRILNQMDGKITRSLHIIEVEKRGEDVAGYSEGGKLPGYGGGDSIPAMVEPGEFIVRKEAVKQYGASMLHALNKMTLNVPKSPVMKFAKGGMVPSTRETFNVNFRLDDMEFPMVMQGGDSNLAFKEFLRQIEKKRLVSTTRG